MRLASTEQQIDKIVAEKVKEKIALREQVKSLMWSECIW